MALGADRLVDHLVETEVTMEDGQQLHVLQMHVLVSASQL